MPTLRQNCLRRMAGGDQVNGLIIATIGLLAIGISLALSPTSVLCKMGCHRWDFPGGKCEDCGVRDVFDEIDDEDTKDAPKSS